MVIGKLIEKSNEILKKSGIQSYRLDTCVLLGKYLGVDKSYLITHKDAEVGDTDGFFEMVERRANHEPVAYITGNKEFMSLEFDITADVLIPRPETELLVEAIIKYVGNRRLDMLDIGTGSGCIAVSCCYYCKNLMADAVDISPEALAVARQNAKKHDIGRINFFLCDVFTSFPDKEYDIIVSNPPYIKKNDLPALMKDVGRYEPESALCGGADGLFFYRVIAKHAKTRDILAFEVGAGQSNDVANILTGCGYKKVEIIKDYSLIERVVIGRYR